jgi:hypothetical protein
MRSKIDQLEEAFVGYLTDHHAFLLSDACGGLILPFDAAMQQ